MCRIFKALALLEHKGNTKFWPVEDYCQAKLQTLKGNKGDVRAADDYPRTRGDIRCALRLGPRMANHAARTEAGTMGSESKGPNLELASAQR
jgi:hypothetical protein